MACEGGNEAPARSRSFCCTDTVEHSTVPQNIALTADESNSGCSDDQENPSSLDSGSLSASAGPYRGIILWDLDETLIVLRSQLRQHAARKTVSAIERLLDAYLDEHFLFDVVGEFDPENVTDHWQEGSTAQENQVLTQDFAIADPVLDMKKYIQHAIATYSAAPRSGVSPPEDWMSTWSSYMRTLDDFSGRWTQEAVNVLSVLSGMGCLHVAVTNTRLVAALAKLKLWGFSSFFEPRWVYSSSHRGKRAVFHRALQSTAAAGIGPELVIAVGDGPEEEAAAFSFMIPFVKVTEAMDLRSVHSLVCAQLQLEYPLPDKSADSSCSLKRRSSVQATCVEIAEDKIFAQTDPLDVPWSTCVCPTGGPLVRSCSGDDDHVVLHIPKRARTASEMLDGIS